MNVVTDTGTGGFTRIITGPTSAHHQPSRISCTMTLEKSDVYRGGLEPERSTQAGRAASPRPSTFSRRRYSKSHDSPYISRPRMKRRGAVSYDRSDAAAEYIRYLGKRINQSRQTCCDGLCFTTQVTPSTGIDMSRRAHLLQSYLLTNVKCFTPLCHVVCAIKALVMLGRSGCGKRVSLACHYTLMPRTKCLPLYCVVGVLLVINFAQYMYV